MLDGIETFTICCTENIQSDYKKVENEKVIKNSDKEKCSIHELTIKIVPYPSISFAQKMIILCENTPKNP